MLYSARDAVRAAFDVLSTACAELAQKMAMKIGGEYVSDKVLEHFDLLAEEAGLAKPMVKQHYAGDLAEIVLSKTPDLITGHPTAKAVAALIQRSRCARTLEKFKKI